MCNNDTETTGLPGNLRYGNAYVPVQVLRNIYSQRKNHRLTEWHSFCDWIKTLPYAHELILHNLD